MLSRLGFPTERSLLRRHVETAADDTYRNPFQHDRDRIIHSRAFRRLADKTQVASLPDSIHCHTRLTHTIEVSQVARTVGNALNLNVDLIEALALAHDIGHPAFGHAGEVALDEEMRSHGLSFDHNGHALRIVEHFERRYAGFRGLNLTFEVREGLLKHSRDLDPANPTHSEYLPHLQPTLEAQLIDAADAIAYLTADLEDAVDGQYLSMEDALSRVPALADMVSGLRDRYPAVSDWCALRETRSRMVGMLVDGLIEGTRAAAQSAGAVDWDDIRNLDDRVAVPTESAAATMDAIRAVVTEKYYNSDAIRSVTQGYVQRLSELFRHYMAYPEALPASWVEQLGTEPLPRLVCDFVAGMTDTFLLRCHSHLLGEGSSSEELKSEAA